MPHKIVISLCVGGALLVSGCAQRTTEAEVERALKSINVIDETNLNHVMLNAADPREAVSYFRRASAENPERLDLRRGLGISLMRAGSATEAAAVLNQVVGSEGSVPDDRVNLAEAYIRSGDWPRAEQELDKIPPTYETFDRYRLEAMVADSNKEWKKADSFYEIALGLTTKPSGVLNNWGYSKLSRGQYKEAERLFSEALTHDVNLFTAKNNLVLARGAQRNYELPVVQMDQIERAQLLHTLGLAAIKQGDITIGKGLLRDAVETHPQHFEAASNSLKALEANVSN